MLAFKCSTFFNEGVFGFATNTSNGIEKVDGSKFCPIFEECCFLTCRINYMWFPRATIRSRAGLF